MLPTTTPDYQQLANQIKHWGLELGFQQVGISDVNLSQAEQHLHDWLAKGYQGEMAYMSSHGLKRSRPALLHADTCSIISVRMDYLTTLPTPNNLDNPDPASAWISRYAYGRDYHKVLRNRLQKLADKITALQGPFSFRAFVDSAPVLEKAIAEKAGLGWIGKHSNLLNRQAGSWFFLGELYTNLPLPADQPISNHCGNCSACLDICPTQAIVAPYQVDARRCISYLTIELHGSIPEPLRPLIGNRIYGCDDCQLICPWNRFAKLSSESDFKPRYQLDNSTLLSLFNWTETEFLDKTAGSAIRRIGYERWLRNIAVALGNGSANATSITALQQKLPVVSNCVKEHIEWALARLTKPR